MSLDPEAVLETGDEEELLNLWRIAAERAVCSRVIEDAELKGNADQEATGRQALDRLPLVSPVQALAANRKLVDLLTGRRWIEMQRAREQQASWEEIGAALGMSRQAAWEWYKRKIEAQERYVGDLHDADRARAALEQPSPTAPSAGSSSLSMRRGQPAYEHGHPTKP